MKKIVIVMVVFVLTLVFSFSVGAQTPIGEKKIHIIGKGETLGDIYLVIRKLCGASPQEIHKWNPWINKNWRLLPKGKEVVYYIRPEVRDVLAVESAKILSKQEEVKAIIKDAEANLKMNLGNVRQQVNIVLTKINQTESQMKDFFLMGGGIFFSVLGLVVILIFIMARKSKQSYKLRRIPIVSVEQKFFLMTVNGQKYLYTPQKKDDYYLSLFRSLEFELPQDAVKSSAGVLKKQPDLIEQEIKAGRLKPKIQKGAT